MPTFNHDSWIRPDGPDVLIRIKAVPGASRDQIAGLIGDRLKIRIAAPPEGGKANEAICTLLARTLDLRPARVIVEAGPASAEKVIRIAGGLVDDVTRALMNPA